MYLLHLIHFSKLAPTPFLRQTFGMVISLPLLVHILFVVFMSGAIIAVSHLLGQRGRAGKIKDTPYECGVPTEAVTTPPVPVKFAIVAVLFVVFDIALVLLLPWAISFRNTMAKPEALAYLAGGITFMALLGVGLIYLIRRGGLNWDK